MRMLELFNDKDIDDLVDIAYKRCMNKDCDACPSRNEFDGEICMGDIVRDLWRKWKNAVEERDASVSVVRCKDCEHRGTDDCPMHYKGVPADEDFLKKVDNDFCSYGERKDEVSE